MTTRRRRGPRPPRPGPDEAAPLELPQEPELTELGQLQGSGRRRGPSPAPISGETGADGLGGDRERHRAPHPRGSRRARAARSGWRSGCSRRRGSRPTSWRSTGIGTWRSPSKSQSTGSVAVPAGHDHGRCAERVDRLGERLAVGIVGVRRRRRARRPRGGSASRRSRAGRACRRAPRPRRPGAASRPEAATITGSTTSGTAVVGEEVRHGLDDRAR